MFCNLRVLLFFYIIRTFAFPSRAPNVPRSFGLILYGLPDTVIKKAAVYVVASFILMRAHTVYLWQTMKPMAT